MGIEDRTPLLPSETQFKPFGLFWNIVKAFAGAGTFALPWAVMNAGLWGGIVGIVLIAVLSNYTVRTLLTCGDRVMQLKEKEKLNVNVDGPAHAPSYPEIGRTAFGEPGAKLVSLFSAMMCFGVCIAYFSLIGGNLVEVFPAHYHLHPVIMIAAAWPIAVFLSCLTDLTKLAYTSIAGSVALLIAMGAVIIYGLNGHLLPPKVSDIPALEWKTIPLFLGGAAFLFCDHVILVPLANTCGNYKKFPRILDYSMIFVTLINLIFAGLSYAFWVGNTCGSVLSNLPANSVVGDIVRIGISLEVLASFPLVANAGFQSLETGFYLETVRAFPYIAPNAPKPFFSTNKYYYLFRAGVITALALVASLVKNFGLLVSLVGSLTIAATGFIFPQVFYIKLYGRELARYDVAFQLLIVLFGIGLTGLGTYQSVDGIVQAFHPSNSTSPCKS